MADLAQAWIGDLRAKVRPDTHLTAAQAAAKCLISVDDNKHTYTVTLPKGYRPPHAVIRQWHTDAGNLGYGIEIRQCAG